MFSSSHFRQPDFFCKFCFALICFSQAVFEVAEVEVVAAEDLAAVVEGSEVVAAEASEEDEEAVVDVDSEVRPFSVFYKLFFVFPRVKVLILCCFPAGGR